VGDTLKDDCVSNRYRYETPEGARTEGVAVQMMGSPINAEVLSAVQETVGELTSIVTVSLALAPPVTSFPLQVIV
jgi:hypothetical protein